MTDLAQQEWLKDQRLARLFSVIEEAGGEVRVAGGAVRNGLWDLPVRDIDVATNLQPERIVSAVKDAGLAVYPTGIEHGTVTVLVEGLSLEVTTLRADVETDGRHAVVAFTKDWAVDAQRRDFTFNALYCNLDGDVFDETGQGLGDHKARRVRFVGDAEQRITEDYLRILRYFRFEAQYGVGDFDEKALKACEKLQSGIKDLSGERIQHELFKMLEAPRVVEAVTVMATNGILARLLNVSGSLAQLALMVSLQDHLKITPDAILRLAVLTSEVSHLRLSNVQIKRFNKLQQVFDLSPQNVEIKKQRTLYELGEAGYRDVVLMRWVQGDAVVDDKDWNLLFHLPDRWSIPVFPLTGADMISIGFSQGKALGEALKKLEHRWIESGFVANKSELLKMTGVIKN